MIRLSGLVTIPTLSEEKGEKWIQKAIEKPGALRKSLKVKAGKKIPAEKLAAAAEKGGKLGKRARLAMTLKKLHEQDNLSEEQRAKLAKLMERVPPPFVAPDMDRDGDVDETDATIRARRVASMEEELDPVGGEDKDINNDGKVDGTDSYLKNRREKIGQAMKMNEDVNGAIDNMEGDQSEDDHEGSMAKADLLALHKQAGELYNMIGEDEQLEGWVQSKITKAADYISSVYNNMQYEKNKPTSVGNGMGAPADADQELNEEVIEEKAPEGWEATVKRMKKHKEIDNPWALAHWMKSKGYHPHAGKKGKK